MLHHVSLNARDPANTARVLAELLDAQAIRAPCPPFPAGAWFVCVGDVHGTLIEVMPWGEVRNAGAPGGVGRDPLMREHCGGHVLMSTPRSADSIFEIAENAGWHAETISAGLFQFIKVWVEDRFLVELLTPAMVAAYVDAFGVAGMPVLDQKLRTMESSFN